MALGKENVRLAERSPQLGAFDVMRQPRLNALRFDHVLAPTRLNVDTQTPGMTRAFTNDASYSSEELVPSTLGWAAKWSLRGAMASFVASVLTKFTVYQTIIMFSGTWLSTILAWSDFFLTGGIGFALFAIFFTTLRFAWNRLFGNNRRVSAR